DRFSPRIPRRSDIRMSVYLRKISTPRTSGQKRFAQCERPAFGPPEISIMDELTRRGAMIGGIAAGLAAAAGVPAAGAEESKRRPARGGGRPDASATDFLGIQLQDIDIDLNGIQYKIPSIPIFPIPIARL